MELGMSEQKIRTNLDSLRKRQNLTIKTTNKFSIISIINWDAYQCEENEINQQINQQITNKQPALNHKQESNKGIKKERKEKILYLDFVYLDPIEYGKLVEQFGEDGARERVDRLNVYIGSTGKKYKSHYYTILNWEKMAGGNGSGNKKPKDVFERLKEKYALEEKEWPQETKPLIS
jgi:hypothetical protein